MSDPQTKLIEVAVGVIRKDNRILLSKRHAQAHQGGLWEFPGGKCEPNETVSQALHRELKEELGIAIKQHRPLIRITHHYPERSVLLDIHQIISWQGVPKGLEGQPIKWVSIDDLAKYPMPVADKPIVDAIKLPDQYVITPAHIDDPNTFLLDLQKVLDNGLKLLQFRVFGLSEERYMDLLRKVQERCAAANAQLMLNGHSSLAEQLSIDGLHLNSRQLTEIDTRPDGFKWVAASCHTPQDLERVQQIGANFAVLSPVMPTQSHPDAEPLGWERFAAMADAVTIPVYALGGMHQDLRQQAWKAGAQGIAGIRGFWPKTYQGL